MGRAVRAWLSRHIRTTVRLAAPSTSGADDTCGNVHGCLVATWSPGFRECSWAHSCAKTSLTPMAMTRRRVQRGGAGGAVHRPAGGPARAVRRLRLVPAAVTKLCSSVSVHIPRKHALFEKQPLHDCLQTEIVSAKLLYHCCNLLNFFVTVLQGPALRRHRVRRIRAAAQGLRRQPGREAQHQRPGDGRNRCGAADTPSVPYCPQECRGWLALHWYCQQSVPPLKTVRLQLCRSSSGMSRSLTRYTHVRSPTFSDAALQQDIDFVAERGWSLSRRCGGWRHHRHSDDASGRREDAADDPGQQSDIRGPGRRLHQDLAGRGRAGIPQRESRTRHVRSSQLCQRLAPAPLTCLAAAAIRPRLVLLAAQGWQPRVVWIGIGGCVFFTGAARPARSSLRCSAVCEGHELILSGGPRSSGGGQEVLCAQAEDMSCTRGCRQRPHREVGKHTQLCGRRQNIMRINGTNQEYTAFFGGSASCIIRDSLLLSNLQHRDTRMD